MAIRGTGIEATVTALLAETGARKGFETVTVNIYGNCEGASVPEGT